MTAPTTKAEAKRLLIHLYDDFPHLSMSEALLALVREERAAERGLRYADREDGGEPLVDHVLSLSM